VTATVTLALDRVDPEPQPPIRLAKAISTSLKGPRCPGLSLRRGAPSAPRGRQTSSDRLRWTLASVEGRVPEGDRHGPAGVCGHLQLATDLTDEGPDQAVPREPSRMVENPTPLSWMTTSMRSGASRRPSARIVPERGDGVLDLTALVTSSVTTVCRDA
jgi:hypothetical protein